MTTDPEGSEFSIEIQGCQCLKVSFFKNYHYPISARNSWSLFFPFIVQTRNLQAVVGVCNILSNRDQCLYNINCNSLSKCIRKQLMETAPRHYLVCKKREDPWSTICAEHSFFKTLVTLCLAISQNLKCLIEVRNNIIFTDHIRSTGGVPIAPPPPPQKIGSGPDRREGPPKVNISDDRPATPHSPRNIGICSRG